MLNFVLLQHLFDFLRVSLDLLTNYDTTCLTSKDFFSSHYILNAFFSPSALKVLSKFYKLILARGFKKRPQHPTTSFPLFIPSALFSLDDLGKISGTHGVRVFRSVVELHYEFRFLRWFVCRRTRRLSGVQMQKERRDRGGGGKGHGETSGGGREGSVEEETQDVSSNYI